MSVPTHNLYDFIHQVLENQYCILYFYPYGSKDMKNVVCFQSTFIDNNLKIKNNICHYDNIPKQIQIQDKFNIVLKIFPKKLSYVNHVLKYNQRLLCYDQEPLDFDFYQNQKNQIDWIKEKRNLCTKTMIEDTENLRWISPDNLQKKWILLHSELNSKEVEKYNQSGKFVCAYWWSHAFISRDWYRFAEYDNFLNPASDLKKLFLIYSRDDTGSRYYRKQFLEKFKDYNIVDYQLGSFFDYEAKPDDSATYNWYDLNSTGISIVLETIFDDRIHLTEKTIRPIACGHPFILLAGPGSLKYIKKYGFKSFSPWINEEYDEIVDSSDRMNFVLKELERLQSLSEKQQKKLIKQCLKISQFNKKLFFSNEFQNQIIKELKDNVNSANNSLKDNFNWQKLKYKKKDRLIENPKIYDNCILSYCDELVIQHYEKGGTLEDYVPPDLD